jgi:CubicO group peptidase (beta-lactamase class C family)
VHRFYSSGGMWRLSQALTHVFGRCLKDVIDECLFGPIGISPDAWEWIPGRQVRESPLFYPHTPGYGDFVDPPYEVNGAPVVGGGGWAVISAQALARFGHLAACEGIWQGHRLLGREWLRSHRGANHSEVGSDSGTCLSLGRVTASGISFERVARALKSPVVSLQP